MIFIDSHLSSLIRIDSLWDYIFVTCRPCCPHHNIESCGHFAAKTNIFNIYPNPTKRFIIIELDNVSKYELSVINVLGQTVYTNSIFEINTRVDLSSYEAGVYTIELSDGNNIYSDKLIIE